MPDAPRIHPPAPRSLEDEDEAPPGDVAYWEAPPEPVPLNATPAPRPRGAPTPPLDLPLPVLVLSEQARRVPEAERPLVAARLNLQLSRMARTGGDRLVADTFLRLLESGRLTGLVDAKGRTCRAAAVEALLSLGFPYALEVLPEDLEHLRANTRQWKTQRLTPGTCMAVLVGGIGAQVVHEALFPQGDASLLTSQVGLSLLAMTALWLAPPQTPVYRVGMVLLTLVSLVAAVVAVLGVAHTGLWVGLAGLVAAFLAALREG